MPSESADPPRRKRSSLDDQNRERLIQEHAAPCVGVAPSKRRRSDEPQDDDKPGPEDSLAGAPEGELFLVTVRARDELTALQDADRTSRELSELLKKLEPRDDVSWAREFQALDELRSLVQFHQEQARRMLEQDVLLKLVLPAVGNLRSAMARNALLCVQELVELPQTAQHFDDVVPVLLARASSEKQFLRDLARDVLDSALDAGAHEALLQPLLATSTTEKNAQIVSVAGLYVAKCVGKMDHARLRSFVLETRSSFLDEMAAFLNCKVVECKAATRRTCQHTRRVVGNETFVALVKEKLSGSAQLDVLKASEVRKAAKPGHAKSSIRERMLQMKRQQQMKVQSEGGDVSVVVVAPPPPRSRSSSTTPSL